MLYPLIIAVALSAFCNTATARMIPPWAQNLPNWKHYKIPQHMARDTPQSEGITTYDPVYPSKPEENDECPTVCIDAINECGKRYGDCLPVCPGEKPALTPPPCPSATAGVMPAHILV